MREKGKGVGRVGGWGRDRQRNRQVNAQALSKLPFSDLPFSFSPIPESPSRTGGVAQKREVRHLCLKDLNNEIHACKTR